MPKMDKLFAPQGSIPIEGRSVALPTQSRSGPTITDAKTLYLVMRSAEQLQSSRKKRPLRLADREGTTGVSVGKIVVPFLTWERFVPEFCSPTSEALGSDAEFYLRAIGACISKPPLGLLARIRREAARESFPRDFKARFIRAKVSKGYAVKSRFAQDVRTDQNVVLRANRLDKAGHTNAALDLLYDSIDETMRKGQFEQIDSILTQLPVPELSVNVLLGILTATLPAKRHLRSREKLYRDIRVTLKNRPGFEEGLLTGLE
jgi:hypothetical protein